MLQILRFVLRPYLIDTNDMNLNIIAADITVMQLNLNKNFTLHQHREMAKKLNLLRSKNYLIIGSGNLIHNLRNIAWDFHTPPFTWAQEFQSKLEAKIQGQDLNIFNLLSDIE